MSNRQSLDRISVLAIIVISLLCLGLWGASAGLWDLQGPDEGRYAQVAKELLAGGHPFILTLHGEPYDQKPPLPFWFFAGALAATGGEVSAWALRIPSILFATLTVLLALLIGRRLWGLRAGVIAALVLMASRQFFQSATTVKLDMMFTGWITLAAWAWLTRPEDDEGLSWPRALAFWGAMAGAMMTKGPLCLLIAISILAGEALSRRSMRPVWRAKFLPGILVAALPTAIWLYIESRGVGREFVSGQVTGETVNRFLEGSHGAPIWYYIPRLFTSIFVPWGLILIPAGMMIWKRRMSLPPRLMAIVTWFVVPFVILSVAHGKRQTYLLPLLPAGALIMGWFLDKALAAKAERPRLARIAGAASVAVAIIGLIVVGIGVIFYERRDLFWAHGFYVVKPGAIAAMVVGVAMSLTGAGAWFFRRNTLGVCAAAMALVVLVMLGNNLIVMTSLNPKKSARHFSESVDLEIRQLGAAPIVAAIGKGAKPEYHVYGHYAVREIKDASGVFEEASALPDLLVCRARDWGGDLAQIARSHGYNKQRVVIASGDELVLIEKDGSRQTDATVQPSPSAPVTRIAITGDTGESPEDFNLVSQQIAALNDQEPIEAVFLLGDQIYDDGPFDEVMDTVFAKPFSPVLQSGIQAFGVLGNHEYKTRNVEAMVNMPELNMRGRRYYSVSVGGGSVEFFILDSDVLAEQPEQFIWLRNELRQTSATWKILLLHHPIDAGPIGHGASKRLAHLLRPVLRGEPDIDLVIAGHNHIYERRQIHDGVAHITVGIGSEVITRPLADDDEQAAKFQDRPGFVTLEFSGDQVLLRGVDENGQEFDRVVYQDLEDPSRVVVKGALASAK